MKKLLLVLTVFFATVSSSFAYQSYTLYPTDPSGNHGSAQVNINGYYTYVGLQAYFAQSGDGGTVAYESGGQGTLIGEYYYSPGMGSNFYNSTVTGYRYWGSVQMYLSCHPSNSGYATLFWTN